MCKVGGSSPWGRIQHAIEIVPGMWQVHTAGHGGMKIDRAHMRLVPDYMQSTGYSSGGWYEEDSDWCIPFVVFEGEIRAGGNEWAIEVLDDGAHLAEFRNAQPDMYEKFFSVTLEPGQSRERDEQVWRAAHAGDLIVRSAWGDWQTGVPAGYVGVMACIGGRWSHAGGCEGGERWFLVPVTEYHARGLYGFVVDPSRHIEVSDFTRLVVAPAEVSA